MAKQKLTPWFPANFKPVRHGWYETRLGHADQMGGFIGRRFWNGLFWSYAAIKDAQSATQNWQWRGLAYDPKGGKK